MPRIINAYDGNSALGKTLADLGELIYGDQAQREVYRQTAFSKKRENDNAEPLAAAVRDGNQNNIGYYGVLAGKTGQDAGDYNRLATTNHATSFDDPKLAISMMGAGGSAGNTAVGQRRSLDNAVTTTGMNNAATLESQRIASDRARDTQLAIDSRTLTPVVDENGIPHYQPKSQAVGGEAPMSTDSVVAGVLRRQAAAAQPAQLGGDPFGALDPRILKKAGLDLPEQSLIEPRTGQTSISRDGGRTAILPDGRSVPATGFQPVGQDAALTQARDNGVRASATQPLVVGNPANSQAAADAANTTGIGSKAVSFFNDDVGAIPGGPAVLNAATGSPEIAPGVQRSRAQQDVRNNAARAVLLGGPGRQTVQAQKWVNDLIPQGDAFANPATEAAKIPTIVNALAGDHEQIRQLVIDPNTAPAERVKLVQQLHQIENTIRMYTDPAPAAPVQPVAPGPAAAPTAGALQAGADPLSQARAAIAAGANPAAVKQRLQQNGIDPSGL